MEMKFYNNIPIINKSLNLDETNVPTNSFFKLSFLPALYNDEKELLDENMNKIPSIEIPVEIVNIDKLKDEEKPKKKEEEKPKEEKKKKRKKNKKSHK